MNTRMPRRHGFTSAAPASGRRAAATPCFDIEVIDAAGARRYDDITMDADVIAITSLATILLLRLRRC